ncbi:MAG TPA: hypothetical protein VFV38_17060 [Ktedonobacteraceae bacterium]|nr:hypothetical protein [Ktedonobacteraceae bacterium]
MTDMFRLDTYPEEQLTAGIVPHASFSTPPLLCCLLHTGPLPASHQVQVWVGGVHQHAEQEGRQQVFSWHCAQGCEMCIHLLHQGRIAKAWRGWWQGEITLAHTGTLPIQVLCAGVLQPPGLTPSPAMSSVPLDVCDQHQGAHPQAVTTACALPTVPDAARVLPPTEGEHEDDLWATAPQEAPFSVAEMLEGEETEGETDLNLRDDGHGEEGMRAGERGEQEQREYAGPAEGQEQSTTAAPPPALCVAPAGTRIATLPALPVWSASEHQDALDRLAALLSTMPPTTILVDLRQQRAAARSRRCPDGQQKRGLSREVLRALYGGRYWDRGTAIQTTRRLHATRPMRWCRVVSNPDDREGLAALVTALERGFSLVLLDEEASSAHSARAAVLAELRQRVANLEEGSCS